MIKNEFFNCRFFTYISALILNLTFIGLIHTSSAHAMAPHQAYIENNTEEDSLESSVFTISEGDESKEIKKLGIEFITLATDHHFLKIKKSYNSWEEVKKSKAYAAGQFVTQATSYVIAYCYILTPCMITTFRQTLRGYDIISGCNLPTSIQDEDMVWICNDETRFNVALASLIPVGYYFHRKLIKLPDIISHCTNYCSQIVIEKYEQYKDESIQRHIQKIEKLILEMSHQLLSHREELRRLPTQERKLIFHAASLVGQLDLMTALLNPDSPKEQKIYKRIQRIIEDNCSICLEGLNQKDSPLNAPIERACNHVFHLKCLMDWYKVLTRTHSLPNCPLCRSENESDREERSHLLNKHWPLEESSHE
jgi:hypothetical protein